MLFGYIFFSNNLKVYLVLVSDQLNFPTILFYQVRILCINIHTFYQKVRVVSVFFSKIVYPQQWLWSLPQHPKLFQNSGKPGFIGTLEIDNTTVPLLEIKFLL